MDVSVANGSLAKLLELGRRRGELATEDLQQFLPIDRMSDEEIARTVAYLEDHGVEIAVDPDLLAGPPRSAGYLRGSKAPHQRVHRLETDSISSASPRRNSSRQDLQTIPPAQRRFATLSIFVAGLIVCGVVAVLVWTLR